MTLEELKAEAKRQGYSLIKYNPLPKMIPCVCGNNKRYRRWRNTDGDESVSIVCTKCGREIEGWSERETRIRWNKAMSI